MPLHHYDNGKRGGTNKERRRRKLRIMTMKRGGRKLWFMKMEKGEEEEN